MLIEQIFHNTMFYKSAFQMFKFNSHKAQNVKIWRCVIGSLFSSVNLTASELCFCYVFGKATKVSLAQMFWNNTSEKWWKTSVFHALKLWQHKIHCEVVLWASIKHISECPFYASPTPKSTHCHKLPKYEKVPIKHILHFVYISLFN